MNKQTLLRLSDNDYTLKDIAFRKFYWYDHLNHINERVIRSEEFLLNEFRIGNISLQTIEEMNEDQDKLYKYLEDFNYHSDYELKDVDRTLYILIEYIKKGL